MRAALASVLRLVGLNRAELADLASEDHRRRGGSDLGRAAADAVTSLSSLVRFVKTDLGDRFERGERPTVADYLRRFPELREHGDRVVSLVYEEFCLLEDRGEAPDPDQFCDQYEPWRDSLASQLRYHLVLSQVVGVSPPPKFPEPGDRFKQFELCSLLGKGGSARVFLARDDSLGGREVALKVSPDRGMEPSIMGRLDHIHIVPVWTVEREPETGLRGLSMPFRPGLPLDDVIKRLKPSSTPRGARALWDAVVPAGSSEQTLPDVERGWQNFPILGSYADGVAWVVATLAQALGHAHSRGILHRDVKPANVLLTLRDGPQLLDFNLAHDPRSADQAKDALRGGTLPYMAPEQLEAYLEPELWDAVGASAELYSLGLLMHELLTGRSPGAPDQDLPPARAIRELLLRRADPVVSPRSLNPTVPHALDAIVVRCLKFAPGERYPDAMALADDLQMFLDRRPLRHASNNSALERTGNWVRRSGRHLALSTVVAMALAVPLHRFAMRIIPVEHRGTFRDAVESVRLSRTDEAIRALKPLVEDYPNSPLALFFLGLAKDLVSGDPYYEGDRDVVKNYSLALGKPEAEASFRAWSYYDPDIARQLEAAGKTLLKSHQDFVAARASEIALHLNPKLDDACHTLAWVESNRRQYKAAHDRLTRMLDAVAHRNAPVDRNNRIAWFANRAEVSLLWGDELRRQSRSASLDSSRKLFLEALDDLKRGADPFKDYDEDMRDKYNLLTARVKTAQGDLEADLGRSPVARHLYSEASDLIKVRPQVRETADAMELLLRDLARRLNRLPR